MALRQELIRTETMVMLDYLAARNPKVTVETLVTLARLDESFILNPESGWVDGMIDKIPPHHPLPERWQREIRRLNQPYIVT